MNDFKDQMEDRNVIKLRGLPWTATTTDILEFLKDVNVLNGEKGIHINHSNFDGRPNGECFVEVESPQDVDTAFTYNKNSLGHRYIEIFNAKPEEFDQCLRRQNVIQQDTFIKLRGLPFSCKVDDIEQFFEGLEIRNNKTGIYIVYDYNGRMTGECFVQFRSSEDAENALKRNREKIGHRYIEIFRSSSAECRRATTQPRNMNNSNSNFGGGNDRMNRPGPGPRNQRNFRDRQFQRPYPDNPWSDNNRGWNNRGNNDNGNNYNNDNFGNNNPFNDNYDFGSDRPWKSNNNGNNFNNSDRGFGGGNNNFGNNSFGNSDRGFGNSNNNNNSFGNNFNNRDRDGSFGNMDRGFSGNNMSNNYGGGNNNGGGNNSSGPPYLVHMRGLPFSCGDLEIHQFFAPLKLVDCQVLFNNGRHTGEADAYFGSVADAQEAMKKHKEKMGSRYIELFASRNSDRRGRF